MTSTFVKEHFHFVTIGKAEHQHQPDTTVYSGPDGYTATCYICQAAIYANVASFHAVWEVR
jgi:hypothetical protein